MRTFERSVGIRFAVAQPEETLETGELDVHVMPVIEAVTYHDDEKVDNLLRVAFHIENEWIGDARWGSKNNDDLRESFSYVYAS